MLASVWGYREFVGPWYPESLPSWPFIYCGDCLWAALLFSYSHFNNESFLQQISLYLWNLNNSFSLRTTIVAKTWDWEDRDKYPTAFKLIVMPTGGQLTAITTPSPNLGVILWFCWEDLLLGRDPFFLFN